MHGIGGVPQQRNAARSRQRFLDELERFQAALEAVIPGEAHEVAAPGDDADAARARQRLRPGARRRGEREQGKDDVAALHWITSSARTSSDCGMLMPSAFAVCRLMISSNLVGCSIGNSAGFA